MPNWCNNSITIQGSTDTVKTLWENAQEGQGLLQAMVPPPENMFHGNLGEAERRECAEKGIPNWYDWNIENWGTKWDVDLEGLEFTDNGDGTASISGWFDSAWSPPIEAVQTYGEENQDVSITLDYNEGGMCFVGQYVIENGCGFDDCVDYSGATADTVRDIIGEAYDDHWNLSEQMAEWEEDFDDA